MAKQWSWFCLGVRQIKSQIYMQVGTGRDCGGGHKLNNIYIFLKHFLELLFCITFSRPCIIIPN
jgi:hypothetical protein